jgi:hypothetical protein
LLSLSVRAVQAQRDGMLWSWLHAVVRSQSFNLPSVVSIFVGQLFRTDMKRYKYTQFFLCFWFLLRSV